MELLVNDLSIAGQFPDVPTLMEAIGRIMKMRSIAQRFGRELHCHRDMARAQVTRNHTLQQAIQHFSRDQQQAVMQWLTRHGPFWEDMRAHSVDGWLECNGNIVTETSVGEAAYCCFHGADRHLVSLAPSSPEGQRLYQDHFTGDNVWFSDSSDAEKRDFRKELTFRHPTAEGEHVFCALHGKVKTPQLRIHFSWPVRADEPLFVVYVGPKITKQ